MSKIRIGRFDEFRGRRALLIDADSAGLQLLIDLIRQVQRSGSVRAVEWQADVTTPGDFRFCIETVAEDRGLVTDGDGIRWSRSSEGWSDVVDKLRAMREAGEFCHQYLDGPADDVQVVASTGEYDDGWWRDHAG
jgi:hypothetical protein